MARIVGVMAHELGAVEVQVLLGVIDARGLGHRNDASRMPQHEKRKTNVPFIQFPNMNFPFLL